MTFKLHDKELPIDVPFTSNGVKYPANWLRLSTLEQKKEAGLIEVVDDA